MIKVSSLDKKKFFNNIFKIGYAKKSPKNFKNDKYFIFLVRAFQRRFRQELVNGKIDNECLIISENLAKKLN